MTELVLPSHANALGTAFGGALLSWIDVCAAIAAQRHCQSIAVTAAIDDMQFLAPVHVGDVLSLEARVHAVFRTSLEVGCEVRREGVDSLQRELCAEAFLTFVSRDAQGAGVPCPPLLLETDEDRRRSAEAHARREHRLRRKQERLQRVAQRP